MKKIVFAVFAIMMGIMPVKSEIKIESNTFTVVSSREKTPGVKTKFTWKDSKGIKYPVMRSKKGAYYIVRVSGKTGKEYNQYLPKEVQAKMKQLDK